MVLLDRYSVPDIAGKYLFLILMSSSCTKTSHMCVFPASHLKVPASNEKGLADEQSSFADFFCSWRHPFSPDGMRDSVARGSKFQPKNIKRAEKYFEGLGN
jgi:hypothetical protein